MEIRHLSAWDLMHQSQDFDSCTESKLHFRNGLGPQGVDASPMSYTVRRIG